MVFECVSGVVNADGLAGESPPLLEVWVASTNPNKTHSANNYNESLFN